MTYIPAACRLGDRLREQEPTTTGDAAMPNKNGMNWARQDLRLAVYLRDGAACVWCGSSVEDGAQLTLDHVVCREQGGGNEPSNLITACHKCNSTRGNRSYVQFAKAVAEYVNHGVTAEDLLNDIDSRLLLDVAPFRAEAKTLIARRGSAAKALASLSHD